MQTLAVKNTEMIQPLPLGHSIQKEEDVCSLSTGRYHSYFSFANMGILSIHTLNED